jgi:hypothetical protein
MLPHNLQHIGDLDIPIEAAAGKKTADLGDALPPGREVDVYRGSWAAVAAQLGMMLNLRVNRKGCIGEGLEKILQPASLYSKSHGKKVAFHTVQDGKFLRSRPDAHPNLLMRPAASPNNEKALLAACHRAQMIAEY